MGIGDWKPEDMAAALGGGTEGQVLRVHNGRLVWSDDVQVPSGQAGQVVAYGADGRPVAADLGKILPQLAPLAPVPSGNQAQLVAPTLVNVTVVAGLVGAINGLLLNQEALRKQVNDLTADLKAKSYMAK